MVALQIIAGLHGDAIQTIGSIKHAITQNLVQWEVLFQLCFVQAVVALLDLGLPVGPIGVTHRGGRISCLCFLHQQLVLPCCVGGGCRGKVTQQLHHGICTARSFFFQHIVGMGVVAEQPCTLCTQCGDFGDHGTIVAPNDAAFQRCRHERLAGRRVVEIGLIGLYRWQTQRHHIFKGR